MKTLFLSTLIFLSGCESPLFDHEDEYDGLFRGDDSFSLFFPQAGVYAFGKWGAISVGPEVQMKLSFGETSLRAKEGPFEDPGYEVEVFLWMPTMDHGSAPTSVAKEKRGNYQVREIFFIMGGLWDVHVRLKRDGKVVESQKVSLVL